MFRKNGEACREWSPENVALCADRQDEILEYAAQMLRNGGSMVYSTCTFAPAEDEGSISRFLERHPEFVIEDVSRFPGMDAGHPAWAAGAAPEIGLEKTIRLWPHKLAGEGHYLAVLKKSGSVLEGWKGCSPLGIQKGMPPEEYAGYTAFETENLQISLTGTFFLFGDQLYLGPEAMPALRGLKVLRPGLHLGTMKKNRFEPSHALAHALQPEEVKRTRELSADSREAGDWIAGLTLGVEGEKGWYLMTVDGYSLGWGKLAGGMMKNHYPKGLRKTGIACRPEK